MVVLGRHEDERVCGIHRRAPVESVLLGVLVHGRMVRLVHEGQCDLRKVCELHVEAAVRHGHTMDPFRDGETDSAGANTSDDDE